MMIQYSQQPGILHIYPISEVSCYCFDHPFDYDDNPSTAKSVKMRQDTKDIKVAPGHLKILSQA